MLDKRQLGLLLDGGPGGQWATHALSDTELLAPSVAVFEAANIIRRQELAGLVSADQAAQAHADLLALAIEYWPYELLAARAWELRHDLPIDDAGYVALPSSPMPPSSRSIDESAGHRTCCRCRWVMPAARWAARPWTCRIAWRMWAPSLVPSTPCWYP